MSTPILEVQGLTKHFASRERGAADVRAVDGIDLTIEAGDMFGLVGESGSGKTTFGQSVLRMQEPSAGSVRFKGQDILSLEPVMMRRLRAQMQYVFQDPFGALNPRLTIQDAIGEPMRTHGLATRENERERVTEVLRMCGLDADALDRFPHEFSGGQRQRIVIARAMGLEPEFVVADEPVSALDVSIQAQIINLFSDLRAQRSTAFLFISHDLGIVEHLCTKVAIMYRGRIVEQGTRDQIFDNPLHPYTRELLSAVPVPDPRRRERRGAGVPERAWAAGERPALRDTGDGHLVAL